MSAHPDNEQSEPCIDCAHDIEAHGFDGCRLCVCARIRNPEAATLVDTPTKIAIEILQRTHDGDDLTQHHLALIQAFINGECTDSGKAAVRELLTNVRQPGGYVKPYYHEFEHLTQDLEGYVYWRGVQVEHYSFRDYDAADVAARKLVDACRAIEARGETVDGRNVLDQLATMRANLRAALRGDV